MLQGPGSGTIVERAVHDTVAAIVASRDFQRDLKSSLMGRVLRAVFGFINDVIELARRVPHGRTIAEGIALTLVIVLAIRIALARRLHEEQSRIRIGRAGGRAALDPWTEAEALAAAGDYTGASHAIYAAVLETLAVRDRLRLHPSKTGGDYARELRRRGSSAHAEFRAFVRRFDAAIYGVGFASAEDYATLKAGADAITRVRAA